MILRSKFSIILIIIFFTLDCIGQNRVYSTTKTNLLYMEIFNPFKIIYQNINCDSIEIESQYCQIRKGINCEFQIKPHKTGKLLFKVIFQKTIIDTLFIDTKKVPEFEVTTKRQDHFRLRSSLVVISPIIDYGYLLTIEKFKMQLIRNDSVLIDKIIDGDTWVDDIDFKKSKKNDKLYIYEAFIKTIDSDNLVNYNWENSNIIITIN